MVVARDSASLYGLVDTSEVGKLQGARLEREINLVAPPH